MGIEHLHTTINYKELIERQANAHIERIPKEVSKNKVMKKNIIKPHAHNTKRK